MRNRLPSSSLTTAVSYTISWDTIGRSSSGCALGRSDFLSGPPTTTAPETLRLRYDGSLFNSLAHPIA